MIGDHMLSSAGRATALLATGAVALTAPRAPRALDALSGADLPAALGSLLELALLGVASWAVLGLALGSLRGTPGRLGRSLVPTMLRAAVFTGVTGSVLAAPAHAADGWPLDGLQLPERTSVTPTPVAPAPTEDPPDPVRSVVVESGDTLWALARTGLDDDATDALVAREVRRWHRENRAVVGPDPDVLEPGQRLTPPRTDGESR